jgi:hypothetical protein
MLLYEEVAVQEQKTSSWSWLHEPSSWLQLVPHLKLTLLEEVAVQEHGHVNPPFQLTPHSSPLTSYGALCPLFFAGTIEHY